MPDQFIPQIIGLVLEGWAVFEKPPEDALEVQITKKFCVCLRGCKRERHLPFRIWAESMELDPESGSERGRLDLRFVCGCREDVYFAFECKRLNVVDHRGKRRSLAPEYVEQGMMRFVEGKYARGLDKGGMLGYVMDGRTLAAIEAVDKAVGRRRRQLRLVGAGLESSPVRPDEPRVRQTRHELAVGPLLIHHVFLAVG
ncbi:MAG: hypothetical protein ACLF0G_11700 [Candidatus Brocadiia bacterium]